MKSSKNSLYLFFLKTGRHKEIPGIWLMQNEEMVKAFLLDAKFDSDGKPNFSLEQKLYDAFGDLFPETAEIYEQEAREELDYLHNSFGRGI